MSDSSAFRNALRVVVAGLNGWGAGELADEVQRVGAEAATWMAAVDREQEAARARHRDTRTPRHV